MSELKRTPLHAAHLDAGARMAPFAGWRMPVAYGSQIEEHHAVRRAAGMFDVSHMTIVDAGGPGAKAYLRRLLANDVARLDRRRGAFDCAALYSCMLNERGGILDDLIVYRFSDDSYRLVVNAATRDKDLAWLNDRAAGFDVELAERHDLAMIAVQGPQARRAVAPLVPGAADAGASDAGAPTAGRPDVGAPAPGRSDAAGAMAPSGSDIGAPASGVADVGALAPFTAARAGGWLLARTGYTGEDGLEIMLPERQAEGLWGALRERGVVPCGLGARDTLRLEAGMNLYGQDMDESVTPLECGLMWTVDFGGERAFIGRRALEDRLGKRTAQTGTDTARVGSGTVQTGAGTARHGTDAARADADTARIGADTTQAGAAKVQLGLVLEGRGVLRSGYKVESPAGEGVVTSGTFSPTLGRAIALARAPAGAGSPCHVFIRGRKLPARVVKPPFVRNGTILVDLEPAD